MLKQRARRGRTPLTFQLNAMPIGGIDLFAPRSEVTRAIDEPIHQAIIDRFSIGTFTDGPTIHSLFSSLTDLYATRFQQALNESASMTLLGLALGQYDMTALLEKRFKAHTLSDADAKLWRNYGPMVRRSIKWLCETLTRRSELPNDPPARTSTCMEAVWHIAEEMVRWCEMSDQTRYIAADVSSVTIHPVGSPIRLTHEIHNFDDHFFKRIEASRDNESLFLPDSLTSQQIDRDLATLDPVFLEHFGVTYDSLLTTFVSLIEDMPSQTTGFDIPEVRFSDLATQFAKNLGVPRDVGRTLLDGFTIDKVRLDTENRKVWETQKHYRLFRRGMIVVRRDGKAVITWSREMARGALNQLMMDMCFQKIPAEWQCDRLVQAVSKIAVKHGKQFELLVGQKCQEFGIQGVVGRMAFGTGSATIHVPPEVGEIDFLGYAESMQTLTILEGKGVWTGSQSRSFRNDMVEFDGEKASSFAIKFRRKIDWVIGNTAALCKALESEPDLRGISIAPTHLASAFVTRNPIYLRQTACGIPTLSIVEFCMGLAGKSDWPFGNRVEVSIG